ncbi:unnamed protein product, partial [Ixodes hexagonus]
MPRHSLRQRLHHHSRGLHRSSSQTVSRPRQVRPGGKETQREHHIFRRDDPDDCIFLRQVLALGTRRCSGKRNVRRLSARMRIPPPRPHSRGQDRVG